MTSEYAAVQRMALAFALETETWPVFVKWCKENDNDSDLVAILAMEPEKAKRLLQAEWMIQSPNSAIIKLGERELRKITTERMNESG